jgi:hypothetical protein
LSQKTFFTLSFRRRGFLKNLVATVLVFKRFLVGFRSPPQADEESRQILVGFLIRLRRIRNPTYTKSSGVFQQGAQAGIQSLRYKRLDASAAADGHDNKKTTFWDSLFLPCRSGRLFHFFAADRFFHLTKPSRGGNVYISEGVVWFVETGN